MLLQRLKSVEDSLSVTVSLVHINTHYQRSLVFQTLIVFLHKSFARCAAEN